MTSGTFKGIVRVVVEGIEMCEVKVDGEAHYKEVMALLMQRFVMAPYQIICDFESWAMPKQETILETLNP